MSVDPTLPKSMIVHASPINPDKLGLRVQTNLRDSAGDVIAYDLSIPRTDVLSWFKENAAEAALDDLDSMLAYLLPIIKENYKNLEQLNNVSGKLLNHEFTW